MDKSIWMDRAMLPEFPALDRQLQVDVLILGGGLTGILCAYQLRQQGIHPVILEADRICGGATGHTTAKITTQHGLIYERLLRELGYHRARGYWEANEAALKALCNLAAEIPCDLERQDSYLYTLDSRSSLEGEMKALRGLGIPYSFVSQPGLPMETGGAIRFENQAQFQPLKLAAQLAKDLEIYEKTRVLALEGNRVITDRGAVRAEKIIVATHFPIFNRRGGYFLRMYQQRSYVMALENAPRMDGMYLDASGNGYSFRSYQNALILGGGSHRTGKQGSGWESLEEMKLKYYPEAREVYRWANQDCMTLDGIPYIGQYSAATPNVYVATGYQKWGMTSAMVSAMILADLVQGRENPYGDVFTPQRSCMHLQLLANGLESTINLLKPTRPRCSHLGCALKWNPWEHSWDCPCHGSRFAQEGTVLDGPAIRDL